MIYKTLNEAAAAALLSAETLCEAVCVFGDIDGEIFSLSSDINFYGDGVVFIALNPIWLEINFGFKCDSEYQYTIKGYIKSLKR